MKKPVPVTPMKSGEPGDVQLMFGIWNSLDSPMQKRLEKRLRDCGQWANYRMMTALSEKVFNGLMETVPPDKAARFLMQLGNQELRVCPIGNVQTRKGFVLLEEEHLRDLLINGLQNSCLLCDGTNQDRKDCKFRKIIKDVCMFECEESAAQCRGQWLLARYKRDD